MSEAKALSERIAACCPCRTSTPCFLSGSAKERTKQSCVCGSHKLKEVDGWRILEPKPCLWPGHAVEAEVAGLEQTVKLALEVQRGAEVRTAQYVSDRMAAEKRAESAEALLAEAPEPPANPTAWTQANYMPWYGRVRAAVGK